MAPSPVRTLRTGECPLYAVSVTRGGNVILAGGGGHGRYGVPNVLSVHSVHEHSDPETALPVLNADAVARYTPEGSVANLALHPKLPIAAAGVDGFVHLLSFEGCEPSVTDDDKQDGGATAADKGTKTGTGKARKAGAEADTKAGEASKKPEIKLIQSQRTDHSADLGFQNCVRFSPDGSRIATGGEDGKVRVWAHPSLKLQHTLEFHKEQVDSLDFDPTGKVLISICNSDGGAVWSMADGKKKHTLAWSPSKGTDSHVLQSCRFVTVEGESYLLTTAVPKRHIPRKTQYAYLVRWNTESWEPIRAVKVGPAKPTCMCVSNDNQLVAIGDNEGFVTVVRAADMVQKFRIRSNVLFITDVAFLPSASGGTDGVITTSADKICAITPLTATSSGSLASVLIGVLLVLIAVLLALFSGLL